MNTRKELNDRMVEYRKQFLHLNSGKFDVDIKNVLFADLFNFTDYQLITVIPDQRDFVWTKKEVHQTIDDLEDCKQSIIKYFHYSNQKTKYDNMNYNPMEIEKSRSKFNFGHIRVNEIKHNDATTEIRVAEGQHRIIMSIFMWNIIHKLALNHTDRSFLDMMIKDRWNIPVHQPLDIFYTIYEKSNQFIQSLHLENEFEYDIKKDPHYKYLSLSKGDFEKTLAEQSVSNIEEAYIRLFRHFYNHSKTVDDIIYYFNIVYNIHFILESTRSEYLINKIFIYENDRGLKVSKSHLFFNKFIHKLHQTRQYDQSAKFLQFRNRIFQNRLEYIKKSGLKFYEDNNNNWNSTCIYFSIVYTYYNLHNFKQINCLPMNFDFKNNDADKHIYTLVNYADTFYRYLDKISSLIVNIAELPIFMKNVLNVNQRNRIPFYLIKDYALPLLYLFPNNQKEIQLLVLNLYFYSSVYDFPKKKFIDIQQLFQHNINNIDIDNVILSIKENLRQELKNNSFDCRENIKQKFQNSNPQSLCNFITKIYKIIMMRKLLKQNCCLDVLPNLERIKENTKNIENKNKLYKFFLRGELSSKQVKDTFCYLQILNEDDFYNHVDKFL